MNPSIAIKFLRDGVESANQFGMISFDGIHDESDPWNWYAMDLRTHLPQFAEDYDDNNMCTNDNGEEELDRYQVHKGQCGAMTAGRWLGQAAERIFSTGNVELARFD